MTQDEVYTIMRQSYPEITEEDKLTYADIKMPGANECCQGGCYPCVWDYYFKAILKRKKAN